MSRCGKCGAYWFAGSHHCRPYEVWQLEDGREEAIRIFSISVDDAAERWARKYNDEGDLTDEDPVIVCVYEADTGEIVYRSVRAELSIDYQVDELTDRELQVVSDVKI